MYRKPQNVNRPWNWKPPRRSPVRLIDPQSYVQPVRVVQVAPIVQSAPEPVKKRHYPVECCCIKSEGRCRFCTDEFYANRLLQNDFEDKRKIAIQQNKWFRETFKRMAPILKARFKEEMRKSRS